MLGVQSTVQLRHRTVVLYHLFGRKEASKIFNPLRKTLTETNANHISASFVEMWEREGRGGKRKERGKKG